MKALTVIPGQSNSAALMDVPELRDPSRPVIVETLAVGICGSVNANRRHYQATAEVLAKADLDWLARLITRRAPLARWQEVMHRQPGDVKTVIDFTMA